MNLLRTLSIAFAVLLTASLQAQTADQMREDTLLLGKPTWGFWAGPTMVQAMQFDGLPLSQNISPRAAFFGHAGFDFSYSFTVRFALRTGLQLSSAPYRLRLDILRYPSNGLSADIQGTVLSDYSYWYADVPLQLEYRRRGGQHHYQVFRLGVLGMFAPVWHNSYTTLSQGGSATTDEKVIEMYIGSGSNSFVRPGLAASVGLFMVQKNHHFVSLFLSGRYMLQPAIDGTYQLFPGTQDFVTNKVKLSGNYIGFELGYTLTRFAAEEKKSQ